MKREEIENFIKKHGKRVKLLKSGRFVLIGTIEEIYSDSLLFSTKQETAIISFETIEEIRTIHNGGNELDR